MSGCHPPDTLALCKHGKPVKFPCLSCAPTHKEFTLLDAINAIEELRNRIEALHEHKLRQIDENRKISKKVDDLEELIYEEKAKLRDLINMPNVAWSKYNKTPYQCPVCKGEGKIIINNGQVLTSYPLQYPTKICTSCEGKGIVWG